MTKEIAVVEKMENLVPVSTSGAMFFDAVKFEFAQRVATLFSKSTMVPEHFRNNVGNCVIALNYAERTGTDPFMCMQKMYVIGGKPAIETTFAVAMFNASGKFSELEYDMDDEKTKCVAFATKLKTGNVIHGPEVSIQMAKNEGWYSKKGSKWQTMPEMMLMYRSAMFFIRQYAPEVLLGMMSRDEIYDTEVISAEAEKVSDLENTIITEAGETDTTTGEVKDPEKKEKKEKKKTAGKKPGEPSEQFQQAKNDIEAKTTALEVNKFLFDNKDNFQEIFNKKENEAIQKVAEDHIGFIKSVEAKEKGDE